MSEGYTTKFKKKTFNILYKKLKNRNFDKFLFLEIIGYFVYKQWNLQTNLSLK